VVVVADCADTALILGKSKPEENKDDVISRMNANITNIRSCGNCFLYVCMYDILPRETLHDITLMNYALEDKSGNRLPRSPPLEGHLHANRLNP
jgi:hypothetical protein